MKPFLKWAGGKRQLLPYIKEFVNQDALKDVTFYEPFIGGGSVFFHLEHKSCVINDLNTELINCYKIIKESPYELISLLKEHQENHCSDYYYEIRALDQSERFSVMSDVEKAARTIYLNRTCYNGLYRVNKKGYFNTPIGRYVNPLICDEENIIKISTFLNENNVKICSMDFEKCVQDAQKGDWIYFDPPYDYEISGFVGYVKEGFNHDDLKRLKTTCDKLIEKGCFILVSNNDTRYVRELFTSDKYEVVYSTKVIKANRNINSKGANRNKVDEVLIYGRTK